jgi:murein L,D-transpeptidase YcbB/YkuD
MSRFPMKRALYAGTTPLLAAALFSIFAPAGAQQNAPATWPPLQERPYGAGPLASGQQAQRPAQGLPDYSPETARATRDAARRYAGIAASGGWPRIAKPLGPDSNGKPVAELRKRLAVEGYLPEGEADGLWDDRLEAAVRRFQSHMGLDQTGRVSRATLRALNIPPTARARQLAATAARLDRMKFRFGGRYVAVNIPAASVEAVQGGEVANRYTAVVGGKRHRSPQIVAKIVSIDINPSWTVPASIVKKELVPKLKRNPRYFSREDFVILDNRGRKVDPARLRRISKANAARFTFRQEPGPKNALGSLRISMPNSKEVYMHDTPNKQLFDRDFRFLSHGCVRVEGVYDLAAWLLNETSHEWNAAALRDEVNSGESRRIRLRGPDPVAWVYMTGWATDNGPAHFRRDIYDLDKGAKALRGNRRVAGRA